MSDAKPLGKTRGEGREVYIVTDGSYSDYRIIAVFATREEAKRLTAIDGGNIETWRLSEKADDLVWWYAFVREDGTIQDSPHRSVGNDPPAAQVLTKNFSGGVLFRGLGRDPEGALKSARDLLTRWQAEKALIS